MYVDISNEMFFVPQTINIDAYCGARQCTFTI